MDFETLDTLTTIARMTTDQLMELQTEMLKINPSSKFAIEVIPELIKCKAS